MKHFYVLLAAAAITSAQPASKQTALDRYVATPDPSFKWELVKTTEGKGYKAYVLDLTSQTWRTEKEVDRTVWKHWLTVIKPDTVSYTTGFLFITGGANNNNAKPPASPDIMLTQMALDTGAVIAELKMVPNQPLSFPDDANKPRTEDGIITYTWQKFLQGGDDSWPLRLPMTKSAVRAMDAVTAFSKTLNVALDKFVVAGGSKRGWTTWTTAAVDKRVVAICPLVIDTLNLQKTSEHQWRAYGFFPPAIKDYIDRGLMDWNGTKEYQALLQIEDPYEYRARLTMPKYIVNAAGDQYFMPDASQFYWPGLKGEKLLRYIPNADHGLGGSDAPKSLTAYFDSILHNTKRPEYAWKIQPNGDIRVTSKGKPTEVKVWTAVNPEARDFRVEKVGRIYKESPLQESKPGVWLAKAPHPEKGFAAYFVELTYPTGGKYPLKVTTQVKISPDRYPFPAYKPEHPQGTPIKK